MDYDAAMNKLQNGKIVTRSSWSNGIYLILLHGINLIYMVYPSNTNNPVLAYICNVTDINATDWQLVA